MGNFNIDSHFDKDANFNKIVIGSGSPVLECELNEMQDITNEQVRNMIRTIVGEGVEKLGTYNYTQGNFRLQNEKAVVDGLPIDITYLTIKASEGQKIFLKVQRIMCIYYYSILTLELFILLKSIPRMD